MRLVDRVAQARTPFIAVCAATGMQTRLSGASDCADEVAGCAIRYVLSDELTRLCAALAYSKGAQTLSCADLVRVPAQRLWIEWANAPWQTELERCGFPPARDNFGHGGRRGALLTASRDGRRGQVRTFWSTGETELDVCASPMVAHFDFDSLEHQSISASASRRLRVMNGSSDKGSVLRNCFEFEFERSWADYYERAEVSASMQAGIQEDSLSTIALDIPVLLVFLLLLNTRSGLPQQQSRLERINRARGRDGKVPLLDHVEVMAPFPTSQVFQRTESSSSSAGRRRPRLHHVRGHLVRRRNELFWRVPHLRGDAKAGVLRSRTVTWAFDRE